MQKLIQSNNTHNVMAMRAAQYVSINRNAVLNNIFQKMPETKLHFGDMLWDGEFFKIDGQRRSILSFVGGPSGWSDQLTCLNEEHSGGQHFIDCASRRHALRELGQVASRPGSVVLEVGCSGGHMLRAMRERWPDMILIASDYTRENLERLSPERPRVPLLQFDLTRCPLPDASVDCVVALNVIEHIENDATAASEIFRILKPGGIAVIEAPAGPELFDAYDEALMHFRRYRLTEMAAMFERQGFIASHRSHLGFFLYPAFWTVKKFTRNRRPSSVDDDKHKHVASAITWTKYVNVIGDRLMKFEASLNRFVSFPFGIRCLLTCKKPDGASEKREAASAGWRET